MRKPTIQLIDKIMAMPEFKDKPPVFLDIGASGRIYPGWETLAQYAVCIAFDADAREMQYTQKQMSYKAMHVIPKIAAPTTGRQDFYLTESPYCSSALEPDHKSLTEWSFGEQFKVIKKENLEAIRPQEALDQLGIGYVDWFKSDSQGFDLRLFQDIKNEIRQKILAIDLEPGIISAYKGEDKLYDVLAYMESQPFWMSALVVGNSRRISNETEELLIKNGLPTKAREQLKSLLPTAPVCAEVTYLNNLEGSYFVERDYLLMAVIAISKRQYGFAAKVAQNGYQRFNAPIFKEIESEIISTLKESSFKMPFRKIAKKIIKFIR